MQNTPALPAAMAGPIALATIAMVVPMNPASAVGVVPAIGHSPISNAATKIVEIIGFKTRFINFFTMITPYELTLICRRRSSQLACLYAMRNIGSGLVRTSATYQDVQL